MKSLDKISIPKTLVFNLTKIEPEVYDRFVDDLCFGLSRKETIMAPIPMHAGRIKFIIERNKSGLNKFTPGFNLYIEKSPGNRLAVLFGKKRAFNKTTNYLISLSKDANGRESNLCLGKLRANKERDKFVLYDNGENFEKLSTFQMSQVRMELGCFMYRYEPCNVGNIRKMVILLP